MQVVQAPSTGRAGAAQALVTERNELSTRLGEIGLQRRSPVLVLVGGADGMDAQTMAELEHLFTHAIAPIADALGAYIVDGGTDTGVMALMGRARTAIGGRFPLVGVVPGEALRSLPAGRRSAVEPHHSHVVVVPGTRWEDAKPWLSWVAAELAGNMPSVTLLINGGDVSWSDALQSVHDGRPVIAVAGSGRAADVLAAALAGDRRNPRARPVLASGLVEAIGVGDGPAALARLLGRHLTGAPPVAQREQAGDDDDALARKDLEELIDRLALSALQKHFLRSRWLDQVLWMGGKARQAQQRYHALRMIVIAGSVAIPVLIGLLGNHQGGRVLAIIAGMLVALSAAIEEIFHYGDRWRHYRHGAERLEAEGWRFLQRIGPYQRFRDHGSAYGEFSNMVERLLEDDVSAYVGEIARERTQRDQQLSGTAPQSRPPASDPA